MQKRILFNLLLLLIAVALGLVVIFTPEKSIETQKLPLTNIQPEQISHIRIENSNGPTFTLERNGNDWWMGQPYRVDANSPRIAILLDVAATPSLEQFPLPTDRLSEYGFDNPRTVVQLNTTKLIFGTTHPYNYRRYVLVGDTVHLIDDKLTHHFLAPPESYISHALIPQKSTITKINTPQWSLEKQLSHWHLLPENPDISADALVQKIQDWENTWVSRVIRSELLNSNQLITVEFADNSTPLKFEVQERSGTTLLVRTDNRLSYHLSSTELLAAPASSD